MTNMVHVRLPLPKREAEQWLADVIRDTGVGDRYGSIPTAALDRLFERMNVGT